MDPQDAETLAVARGTLTDMIEGYRHTGKVSAEHAAWLAGTCTNKGMRDILIASLATTGTELEEIGAALMGENAPEDWGFLKAGAEALYAALEFIPTEHRADLLVAISWTHWIDGKGTEARRFVGLVLESNPGHRSASSGQDVLAGEPAPDQRPGHQDVAATQQGVASERRPQDRCRATCPRSPSRNGVEATGAASPGAVGV